MTDELRLLRLTLTAEEILYRYVPGNLYYAAHGVFGDGDALDVALEIFDTKLWKRYIGDFCTTRNHYHQHRDALLTAWTIRALRANVLYEHLHAELAERDVWTAADAEALCSRRLGSRSQAGSVFVAITNGVSDIRGTVATAHALYPPLTRVMAATQLLQDWSALYDD